MMVKKILTRVAELMFCLTLFGAYWFVLVVTG